MNDCIFCKIVAGTIPAAVVYEDDTILAFMTIEAINEGHTLVIPKQHIDSVHHMDEPSYTRCMQVVRLISRSVEAVFSPKRVGLLVAGWEVPHAHIHVVPMNDTQDLTSKKLIEQTALHPDIPKLKAHADQLKQVLSGLEN